MRVPRIIAIIGLAGAAAFAQMATDPFPTPIEAQRDIIRVSFTEFASIPDIAGVAARIMLLVDEPGSRRMFVNDMRGPMYTVSYDGRTVTLYLDINAPKWGVNVQSMGRERGFQSFAVHPQFNQPGTPGYGKLYTWTDTTNTTPRPDFSPGGGNSTHHTVLLEWTAKSPAAAAYDGGAPREMLRLEQPFANHNAGHMSFHPMAMPGSPEFGLLYVGVADGGSGGDPLNLAQNLSLPFGKILRIDPLGTNGATGKYGVPASNPFVARRGAGVLGEIYLYGVRNPQRFGWDPRNGNLFVADIGQNIVEELTLAPAGANLGWNKWEGSFGFVSRTEIRLSDRRADPTVTYPVVEYDHDDPLLQGQTAVTGVYVYRGSAIPQLANLVLFGDFPSGEIFYIPADKLPAGGHDRIRRVLLNDGGQAKTLLQVIREKNARQGKTPTTRADLRFGAGPDGRVFLLNKHDGTIRLLVPDATASR
jgi:hypothetical protein